MSIPTPRTVYAVSSGTYSDYEVEYLFESRDDAEATVARINHGQPWPNTKARVEEFDLYPPGSGALRRPRKRFTAVLGVYPDATLSEVEVEEEYVEPGTPNWDLGVSDQRKWLSIGHPRDAAFSVSIQSDDETTAVKAVREKASEVVALMLDGLDPTQAR